MMIALIAWYLIFPPQLHDNHTVYIGPNVAASLSTWQAMRGDKDDASGAFSTKLECEDYRAQMVRDAKMALLDAPPNVAQMPSETRTIKWTFALGALKSICIASDDSRFKLN
jgi:hypothetical protein